MVTDKSGAPVAGLQQQDFTLLDNKQPRNIASFHAVDGNTATADPPLKVILLLDTVNGSFTNVAFVRTAVSRFLGRNGGQLPYPVSVTVLTESGTISEENLSRDGNALIAYLDRQEARLHAIRRSEGFYGDRERLQLCLDALRQFARHEAGTPGRKLVVWISPGWPLLNDPGLEMNAEAEAWVFDYIVTLSDALRWARITLYAVDPLGLADAGGTRTSAYKGYLKGVKRASQSQPGNLALQVLANQSGGLVLNSSNDLAGQIAKCVADASSSYVLTFDALPGDGPNEYHALEVKTDKAGVAARTRSGYYAQPK